MELEKSTRPWGRYEVLQETPTHNVKCIWVTPGMRLSYQPHQRRAESWKIVQGIGMVTVNGIVHNVGPGESVQYDIERVEDDFGQ